MSLPLLTPLVDPAEPPLWFGSKEVCRRLGLTVRQLQWWDEQGLLPARHEGHKRLYSGRDAILAGVIGTLRKAGLGQARVQAALQTLTTRGPSTELPRYLVVNWSSGRSYGAQNDRQVLERIATWSEAGVSVLLIDLEQIESKLSVAPFSF